MRQAEANEKHYRDLVETGDVAMITYEQFRTNRDTARARVNAAKQALEASVNTAKQSNEAIKSAQAGVEAARTKVATTQAAVADLVIRAPFSGYISVFDQPSESSADNHDFRWTAAEYIGIGRISETSGLRQ